MKTKNLIIWIAIIAIVALFIYWIVSSPKIGPLGSAHEHAGFKVFIDNEELNFAHLEYMVRDRYVHIENMNGEIIHKHATGITLGYFFKTLGFKFNEKCFVLDSGESYCNDENNKTLKFYVNNEKNFDFGKYEINDGEEYLISYGSESEEEIQRQLDSVKN